MNKPTVVCLCGSTRFYETFQRANYEETMAGRIVLSVGFYPHSAEQAHGESIGITPEQKLALDELHKRKIDLADEVFVLNVGGYVGDSTRSEIEYAQAHGSPFGGWKHSVRSDASQQRTRRAPRGGAGQYGAAGRRHKQANSFRRLLDAELVQFQFAPPNEMFASPS